MDTRNLLPQPKKNPPKIFVSDSTKFKLCVYYSHKPDGSPYSVIDKNLKKHRKYHDSYDYVHTTNGKTVTRHDLSFNKLLHHVEKYKSHIEFALMYVNDFVKGEQHLLAKFFKDEERSIFIMPLFVTDELGIGHVYFDRLSASPIETSYINVQTLKKTK